MDYQLVIQLSLNKATAKEFYRLIMLENDLGITLGDNYDVDGDDLGSGEINIFIHVNNSNNAFELVKNALTDKE